MEDSDHYKAFVKRSEKPLAELREKTLGEIRDIRAGIGDLVHGVAIGISPTDKVLNEYNRGEITNIINRMFKSMRMRGSDGALSPIAPLSLLLVGEYSPKHRWHYHGIIKVNNITTLEAIKKRLRKSIGRTVTECINDTENYVDYMFKQYECPKHGMYYDWNKKECTIMMQR